ESVRLSILTRRIPPSSTLFPYTTLFRSELNTLDALERLILVAANAPSFQVFLEELEQSEGSFRIVGERFNPLATLKESGGNYQRSEEHTSELQSRFDLVCRLLLEKKKP